VLEKSLKGGEKNFMRKRKRAKGGVKSGAEKWLGSEQALRINLNQNIKEGRV